MEKINNHIIYILKLENECWYIGWTTTNCFKKRMKDHWAQAGKGAIWTKLNNPIRVYDIETYNRSLTDSEIGKIEDKITLRYGKIYGFDKVRGGGYCQMIPVWPLIETTAQKRKKERLASGLTKRQASAIAKANRELRKSAKLI